MKTIPIEEMEQDLAFTVADEKRCEAIVENIEGFIRDSGGENRIKCRMDLLKYRVFLETARRRKVTISDAIEHARRTP